MEFNVELTKRRVMQIHCTTNYEAAETLRTYLAEGYPARRTGLVVYVTTWHPVR